MRIRAQIASTLRALAAEAPLEMVVSGNCMEPCLAGGDRIRVSAQRFYLPGDIVAFRREDSRLLVHRVLGYTLSHRGLRLMAKGDRLSREDEPVALNGVLGRVVARRGQALDSSMSTRLSSLSKFLRVFVRRSIRP